MSEFRGFDDPFLRCGHEQAMTGMLLLIAFMMLVTTLAVVKLRDAERQVDELVVVVEKME